MISETFYLLSKPAPAPLFAAKKIQPTPREAVVIGFLRSHGKPATLREITDATGFNKTIAWALKSSEEKGIVFRDRSSGYVMWGLKEQKGGA